MKAPGCAGLDVEHADDFVFRDQRHRQLRTHAGRGVDEVLLRANVVHQHRLAQLHGFAGYPLPHLDVNALGYIRRMADLETDAQLLRSLVQQQDGEHLVIHHPLQHLGHALQQGVEVERGVHRIGNFQQVVVEAGRDQRIGNGRTHERLSMIAAESC